MPIWYEEKFSLFERESVRRFERPRLPDLKFDLRRERVMIPAQTVNLSHRWASLYIYVFYILYIKSYTYESCRWLPVPKKQKVHGLTPNVKHDTYEKRRKKITN